MTLLKGLITAWVIAQGACLANSENNSENKNGDDSSLSGDQAPRSGNRSSPESEIAQRPAAVRRGDLHEVLSLTGELDAVHSENLTVPATGSWQLTIEWMVKDGVELAKGDRVVQFDNSAVSAQIEQKRVAVTAAKRALVALRARAKLSRVDKQQLVDMAVLREQRAQLYASVAVDLISERDWQERQLALETATVALADAQADFAATAKAAALDLKMQKISLSNAEKELSESESMISALTLTAPRSGLAMIAEHPWQDKRKLRAGELVRVGWTVVKIPDLSKMLVRAQLSDVDDGKIAVGMTATVTFDAYPKEPQRGEISAISPVARNSFFGSEMRSFDVEVKMLDGQARWMRPGMSARVDVALAPQIDALIVPRAAIFWSQDGQPHLRSGGGSIRSVVIAACNANECALVEDSAADVKEGEPLVSQGRQ